jgi:type IV pilus assembly protein PilM
MVGAMISRWIQRGRPPVVGIDLGARSVKAVELMPRGGSWEVRRLAERSHGEPFQDPSAVTEPWGRLSPALQALWRENPDLARRVVVGIPADRVQFHRLRIEPMTPEELERILPFEVQERLGLDLAGSVLDAHVLPPHPDFESSMDLLVVVADREIALSLHDLLDTAGLSLHALDAEPLALLNALLRAHPEASLGTTVVLDVGAARTILMIARDGIPLGVRSLPWGEWAIRDAMTEFGSSGGIQRAVQTVVDASLDLLEVSARDEQGVRGGDERLGALYLAGGGGRIDGFDHVLSEGLGSVVLPVQPFRGLSVLPSVDPAFSARLPAPEWMLALGLGLRG